MHFTTAMIPRWPEAFAGSCQSAGRQFGPHLVSMLQHRQAWAQQVDNAVYFCGPEALSFS